VLIRFEVANFRSILDPVELSMVAVDRDRTEAHQVENLGESLVPVAGIYGPNASGKSNVVAALAWLRTAVLGSLLRWDDGIPVEPFAFGRGAESSTAFTLESVVEGVRYEYVLELAEDAVTYEALFHYPEKKRRRVFEREGRELKLQRGLGHLTGTRELLTDRSLVLSIARRFNEKVVTDFVEQIRNIQVLGLHQLDQRWRSQMRGTGRSTQNWFDDPVGPDQLPIAELDYLDDEAFIDRDQALALLQLADLGVDDVIVDDHVATDPATTAGKARRTRRVRLVHRAGTRRVPLEFESESRGTRAWFELIGPVLSALKSGSLLVIDELDASLHPSLSEQLIRLFHDSTTNPHGGQLIFTSHDTSLLNYLNRDEVWLTEKDEDGATTLGALAEFAGERVRRSQNLERAYLHGRFGALPDVDRTEMLRSLGLIA
jgi:predicted ATPase